MASTVKGQEIKDTAETMLDLQQIDLALLEPSRHGGGRQRIDLGANIEDPVGADRFESRWIGDVLGSCRIRI